MTGPEHYTRSQQLLREVRDGHQEGTDVAAILAAAQVHATLALAAATALPPKPGSLLAFNSINEWTTVAGKDNR